MRDRLRGRHGCRVGGRSICCQPDTGGGNGSGGPELSRGVVAGIATTAAVELVARDRNLQSCTAQIAEFNASRASYERTKVQSEAQVEQAEAQHAKAGENLRTAEAAAIGPAELAQAEPLVETTKRR